MKIIRNQRSVNGNNQVMQVSQKRVLGSGWIAAGLILFNGTVGGGLLNLPASIMAAGGFSAGFPLLFFMLIFTWLSHMILGWCADLRGTRSYQETVQVLLGETGRMCSAVVVTIYMFLVCIYLLVGVGDMIERVMLDSVGMAYYCENWYSRRTFISFLVLAFVILPPCLVYQIDTLKYISGLAAFAIFYVVGVVIYEYYTKTTPDASTSVSLDDWTDIFLGIPGISLVYASHYATVSVYSRMDPQNLNRLCCAISWSSGLATLVYVITIVYVCLIFGQDVSDDFISSFATKNWGVRIGFLFYGLKLCLEYPIIQFVGWTCLESFFQKFFPNKAGSEKGLKIRRVASSIVWLILTFTIASIWSSLSNFTSLLSACVLIVTFVIPGLCMVRGLVLFADQLTKWVRISFLSLAIFMVAMGAFLVGVVLVQFSKVIATMNQTKTSSSCT